MRGLLITAQQNTGTSAVADDGPLAATPVVAGSRDLDGPWRLHPRVSLRPEPFGALAYHYDNRRLNFLRSHDLVELVKVLENHDTVRAAFDSQGLDERRWPSFNKALAALAESDFLQPVDQTTTS